MINQFTVASQLFVLYFPLKMFKSVAQCFIVFIRGFSKILKQLNSLIKERGNGNFIFQEVESFPSGAKVDISVIKMANVGLSLSVIVTQSNLIFTAFHLYIIDMQEMKRRVKAG